MAKWREPRAIPERRGKWCGRCALPRDCHGIGLWERVEESFCREKLDWNSDFDFNPKALNFAVEPSGWKVMNSAFGESAGRSDQ
jgi:hypothetical protein